MAMTNSRIASPKYRVPMREAALTVTGATQRGEDLSSEATAAAKAYLAERNAHYPHSSPRAGHQAGSGRSTPNSSKAFSDQALPPLTTKVQDWAVSNQRLSGALKMVARGMANDPALVQDKDRLYQAIVELGNTLIQEKDFSETEMQQQLSQAFVDGSRGAGRGWRGAASRLFNRF